MNILITGGAGSIGSNLYKKLINSGDLNIFIVDNLWRGKLEYLNNFNDEPIIDLKNNFFNLDLTDYDNCLKVTKNIDLVIHLADVVAGINYVFANEYSLFRNNILINSNIYNASAINGVKKIIYVGTACSYPKSKQSSYDNPPLKEDEIYPADPESSYGWSKLIGEYELNLLSNQFNIDTCILRLHNVYGPPCETDPKYSQVIPSLIRKAILYPKVEFEVWGSGKQTRAFVYVDDVINGILSAIKNGFNHGAIQLGPNKSVSIKEIAEIICRISKKEY